MSRRERLGSRFDVIIVGSGPSGSSAARRLAEKGFKTLLVEKERIPRWKPCAGILPPRIRRLIDIPTHLVEREIYGYRVFTSHEDPILLRFPLEPGFAVDRASFDYWLVEEALRQGSKLLQGVQVIGVKEAGDEVRVSTTSGSFWARYLIGADGIYSNIRKALGLPMPRRDQMAFTYQEIFKQREGVIDRVLEGYFEIYYDTSLVREGYLWIAPYKNRFSLGYGGFVTRTNIPPNQVLDGLKSMVRTKLLLRDASILRRAIHPIPYTGPFPSLGMRRTILVGDAGGFVHPITGEGIYFAIRSGYLGAEAIETHSGGEELAKVYEGLVEKRGLARLRDFVERRRERFADNGRIRRYIEGLATLSR